MRRFRYSLFCFAGLFGCSRSQDGPGRAGASFASVIGATRFQRGNLHAHSNASDGDATPDEVIGWYKAHGYAFVALTDHNLLTDPSRYASLQSPEFTVLSGEEVSMWTKGKQVHVNALCTHAVIQGGEFETATLGLRAAISRIRQQDGVAIVNHPNFDWALSKADILAVAGSAQLLEVASGHPYVHSSGDELHPSHEALWDEALTDGHDTMGVAVDDAHHLLMSADPPAYPGVAWVEVFAESPTPEHLCDALSAGRLYASTGPTIRRIAVSDRRYTIEVEGVADSVEFIGDQGRVLARHDRLDGIATYQLSGGERYVRARVNVGATRAWTPAVRVIAAKSTGE